MLLALSQTLWKLAVEKLCSLALNSRLAFFIVEFSKKVLITDKSSIILLSNFGLKGIYDPPNLLYLLPK